MAQIAREHGINDNLLFNWWTDPTPVDKFCPHDWACSKASGLTPPR
ncbi:hypothetical protein [Kosakonia radicincitans]